MKKNVFKKIVITMVVLLTTTLSAYSQSYEVYDGDGFSVMFVVKNEVAHDVKFASAGDRDWTDFEVIETKNWNGNSITNCLFTFYVIDGEINAYQIDYYENNYIWVFQIDDDLEQICKLPLFRTVSFSKYIIFYV